MDFILKFNHGFTNRGYLLCAILKALYSFKEKRAHKVIPTKCWNVIFQILKMFKNKKFTRAACWINSKIRDQNTHDNIILSLLLVIIMVELWKVFNAVELHFL